MSGTVWVPGRGNTIMPALPARAFKTFQIVSPTSTHFRPATCAEVECDATVNGWVTTVDETTELGQKQAHYIRKLSGRLFKENRTPTGLTEFTFPAGQPCFRKDDHKVRIGRQELFITRDGDWRGNPLGTRPRQHTRPEHWVEEFQENQQALVDRMERG
jgi:hypothetical protein